MLKFSNKVSELRLGMERRPCSGIIAGFLIVPYASLQHMIYPPISNVAQLRTFGMRTQDGDGTFLLICYPMMFLKKSLLLKSL